MKNSLWAGLDGWKYVLSLKNPDNLIVIVAPKGTAKSYIYVQDALHKIENREYKYGILQTKSISASHKTTTFPLYQDLIKQYGLRNYELQNTQNDRSIIKGGVTVYFYGAKEQETRLTGWSLPLDRFQYDEYLNSKDNRSPEAQKQKASSTRKMISSIGREILKVNPHGKMIFTMNLHYKDDLFAPLIFDNFDTAKIRSEVEKKYYYFARIKGIKLWPKGISFLFLDPEINQFLPEEIKNMDYGSDWDNDAMKKSIPDDSTNPEYIHKRFINKSIKFTSFKENPYIEPIIVTIDPASGKDEYVILFLGIDFKNNKIIVINGHSLPTKNYKGIKNIDSAIKKLHEAAKITFFELSVQKFTKNSIADFSKMWMFGIDSNQKTSSYSFISDLWSTDQKLEDACFFDSNKWDSQYDFRKTVTVASKNGDFKPTIIAADINDLLQRSRLEFFRNDFTIKLLNQMNNVRSKISPLTQERIIISNGNDDEYDGLRYAIEVIKKRSVLWNLFI